MTVEVVFFKVSNVPLQVAVSAACGIGHISFVSTEAKTSNVTIALKKAPSRYCLRH